MDRDSLFDAIAAARPAPGEVIHVERRGDRYAWRRGGPSPGDLDGQLPDAWIWYSGTWPLDDPAALSAMFVDLLAELESMTGGADRCRSALPPVPSRR